MLLADARSQVKFLPVPAGFEVPGSLSTKQCNTYAGLDPRIPGFAGGLLRRGKFVAVQDGSMRCDVNVSVRPKEQVRFGRRVEIKNMNSFSAMQRAIEFEINRQVTLRMVQ